MPHQKPLHTPVVSIIIWKWSIHYASLSAMLKPLHTKQIKKCTKSPCNQSSHYQELRAPVTGAAPINYRSNIQYTSLSTILHSLHTNMNQDLVENHLCNKVVTMKNVDHDLQSQLPGVDLRQICQHNLSIKWIFSTELISNLYSNITVTLYQNTLIEHPQIKYIKCTNKWKFWANLTQAYTSLHQKD